MNYKTPIIILILIILSTMSYSQAPLPTQFGIVTGQVKDTINNYRLKGATVSIYTKQNNKLLNYQLTNKYGKFKIDNLPLETLLILKIDYIGYSIPQKSFLIDTLNRNKIFKLINATRTNKELADVIIKSIAPVILNGDTLEFNADAFTLDPNAVTEDLLKKLPGVIVWGDGTITVNGKNIASVLVNGKPFFGGETKVATQNIPKNAVDKIQVYQKYQDGINPYDSTSEINIKLKKNKNNGLFGKEQIGLANKNYFDYNGNINYFNSNTQIGLVAGRNNINKNNDSIKGILRNSTYGGTNAINELKPNFNLPGNSRTTFIGATLEHDFIKNPDQFTKNNLKTAILYKNNNRIINKWLKSIIGLSNGSFQKKTQNSSKSEIISNNHLNSNYSKLHNNNQFNISIDANYGHNYTNSRSESHLQDQNELELSADNHGNKLKSSNKNIYLIIDYKHKNENAISQNTSSDNYFVTYSLKKGENNSNESLYSAFIDIHDKSNNTLVNRKAFNKNNYSTNTLSFGTDNASKYLSDHLGQVTFKIKNEIVYKKNTVNTKITDFDKNDSSFLNNNYLSVQRNEKIIDERPGLVLSKYIQKYLPNRYQKVVSFDLELQAQLYQLNSTSSHKFQNFNNNYKKFIPVFELKYNNSQYGKFIDNLSFTLSQKYQFPTVNQLQPLIDSIDLYSIDHGNARLNPSSNIISSIGWTHSGFRVKNNFYYGVFLNTSYIKHFIADSNVVDQIGRTNHYLVNINSLTSLGVNWYLKKSFKNKFNLFLLSLNGNSIYTHYPLYQNSVKGFANTIITTTQISLLYNFKDNLAIEIGEHYSGFKSKFTKLQIGKQINKTWDSQFSITKNVLKHFKINSNITYSKINSSAMNNLNHYSIWNASISYRALKKRNLEFKFSAMDLLRQNNHIINYGYNNIVGHGLANVLQNYYMISISYFPRIFGENKEN